MDDAVQEKLIKAIWRENVREVEALLDAGADLDGPGGNGFTALMQAHRKGSRFAVDGPGNSEAIDDHAEAFGPEGFLEGDDNFAAVGQSSEDAFSFCGALNVQRERKTFGLFILFGSGVGAH